MENIVEVFLKPLLSGAYAMVKPYLWIVVVIVLTGTLLQLLSAYLSGKKKREMRERQRIERTKRAVSRHNARVSAPVCPVCGGEMVLRKRKADGQQFYGCKSFPKCRGIVNVE